MMGGWKAALLAVLAVVLLTHAECFYEGDSKVINLDDKSFEEVLEADNALWLVEFYAPWCGHCKALAPVYEKVAANLQGLVKVAALDADKYKDLATKVGIRGFPTLKVYSPEKTYNPYTKKSAKIPTDYTGPRTAKGMVDNILAELPNLVHTVTSAGVEAFLADDYPKALLFSEKEAVPSLLKSLALQFNGKLRVGLASSSDKDLAAQFGVSEFPKIVAVPGSDPKAAVKHEGKIKSAELIEFFTAHALKEKKPDPMTTAKKAKLSKTLTAETFAADVEKDKTNMWLVYFHKGGKVPQDFESVAESFKAFKAGTLDCESAPQVCKDQVVDKFPALRFYMADKSEYEEFTGKADCIEDCLDLESMSDFVADSIPNVVVPVTEATFNNFVAPSAERPRVLLFSKKDEPTALYKSVSLNYKGILSFGLFASPSPQVLKQANIQKLPALMIFFSNNGTTDTVQGFPYQGGFTFEEMTKVIDQFAEPFREDFDPSKRSTPGTAASKPPTGPIPEVSNAEGSTFDALCGAKGGLCAIAFLDGAEANKEKREEQLKVMESVRTKLHPSPYHISWVDAVCHPDFSSSFDVGSDKIPTLAVISPSKQRYVLHVGKFSESELTSTLQGVLTGKKKTGPYSSVNPLEKRECADVHAEILAAITGGSSGEDDDIMKEMMEEIRRKEAEKGGNDSDDEDAGESKKKKKKKKKSKKK